MNHQSGRLGFLAGGGEMGGLIRAFDWAATPVGAPARWSSSLRTALGILLNSRHPMFLWWGSDLVQFYNDGYRPSLGADRHPSALGARGREFWAEIWPAIGPEIDGVMERGESTWHHDHLVPISRNGRLEEVYWTYGYSPVHDDDGRIGGTLVVVQEQTARVLGERRLRTLRDLAALASSSHTELEVWTRSVAVLCENPNDLPLVCLFDLTRGEPRIAGMPGMAIDPGRLPIHEVVAAGGPVLVNDLRARLGDIPGPACLEPIEAAWLAPLRRPGSATPYGVLVAGASPRLPVDDEYRAFIALAADHIASCITSARVHEEERQRAESLAELDRAKTSFFSNVSHEFRTPLTLMLGPTERALQSAAGALRGADLETVHRNQLRLLKLVNTLLDFARAGAGRAEAAYEATDLAALTADIASAFRSTIERVGLRFDVDCPPLPADVAVDREMWQTIVSNLVSNAFKFTFEGSIAVALHWRGTSVALIVRDTGIGIDAGELPRIFERFHQVANARRRTHEGSGIGLALLQELVKMHDGAVAVTSAPGEGTTFTVTIPVDAVAADGRRRPDSGCSTGFTAVAPYVEEARRWIPEPRPAVSGTSGAAGAAPPATGDFHVLAVDDNADMRDYLRRLLESKWSVETAADGGEALTAAKGRRPDLIVCDVMMPGLDGIGFLRVLRSDAELRTVPVILLTARAGEGAQIEGWNAGADDYLVKPFSARELLARVEAQMIKERLRTVEERHLRRTRDELERRVADRTAALQASNLRLAQALNERTAFEAARSEWLRKLINAQEDERGRVARELHDEMGQHLSVLSRELDELRSSDGPRAARLAAQVGEIERGVRRLARDLRPAALDDLGLVTALGAHVDEWSRLHGIAADFCSHNCGARLAPGVESTLYRIVQEALTNVARHARARRVSVVLERSTDQVTVIIEDDGRGFDAAEAALSAGSMHSGLRGIRERAALLGGTLTIESSAGATSVFVKLPLAGRDEPGVEGFP